MHPPRQLAGPAAAGNCWCGDRVTTLLRSLGGIPAWSPASASARTAAGWLRPVGTGPCAIRDLAGASGLLLRGHTTTVTGIAFSPEGRRLASCDLDASIRVWDAASGQEVLKLAGPEPQTRAVRFSPDGRRVAALGGASDPASPHQPGEVRVWDAGRPRAGVTLAGLTSPVEAVWFTKDGDRLLARGTAGRTLAWSLPQPRPLGEAEETPPPTAGRLAESSGQRFRATGLGDHTVLLVDLGDTDADRAELRAGRPPSRLARALCAALLQQGTGQLLAAPLRGRLPCSPGLADDAQRRLSVADAARGGGMARWGAGRSALKVFLETPRPFGG